MPKNYVLSQYRAVTTGLQLLQDLLIIAFFLCTDPLALASLVCSTEPEQVRDVRNWIGDSINLVAVDATMSKEKAKQLLTAGRRSDRCANRSGVAVMNRQHCYLCVDIGTQSIRTALVDQNLQIIAVHSDPQQIMTDPVNNQIEVNIEHVWESVAAGSRDVLQKSNLSPSTIAGVA